MELSLFTLVIILWFCACETDSVFKLKRILFKRPMRRQVSSSSCLRVAPNTPEFFSEVTNSESDPERLKRLYSTGKEPRNTTTAQNFFKNRESTGKKQFIPQQQQDVGDACIKSLRCDKDARYRTIDGFCNNLEFPEWGVTGSAFVRILPGSYDDEKRSLRRSSSNSTLPSARLLHTSLLPSSAELDTSMTYIAMTWGQLISHDTARIIDQLTGEREKCLCCNSSRKPLSSSPERPSCLPLAVPEKDPFYSKFGATCLHFVRSMTTDSKNCIISPVQIISDVTHFLDASFLYGSTEQEAARLRTREGGLLRSRLKGGAQFPPELEKEKSHCPLSRVCYDAGDDRLNQNPMLAVVQVLFLRLHNRLATELGKVNDHWSDEILYQETRKIVIAAVQRISYKEYLPVILGTQIVEELQLARLEEVLVMNQYDKFLNPGTLVSFTSAAFRVFHTMIPSQIMLFSEQRQQVKSLRLSDVFFKPDVIQEREMFPNFVRGLTFQVTQKINVAYSKEITELLFKDKSGIGLDLVANDIMRGRDHGLPQYTQARISCGLPRPRNFQDLTQIMTKKSVEALMKVYDSVDDVDLYLGAVLETPFSNSPVGPTLQCIIAEQFRRWKFGDRFFYTFGNNPGAFTPAQLAEVEKLSFAKIACIVSNIQKIQPNAFRRPDTDSNKLMPCDSLERIDLNEWQDSNR